MLSSRDLPDLGIKPVSPVSPAFEVDSLLLSHQGNPSWVDSMRFDMSRV